MSKVSISDLAKHLGLGKSTVQRALSGAALVKPATRERVLKAAEELGYQYDFYFAALAARREMRRTGRALVHYFYGSPERVGINFFSEFERWSADFGLEVEMVDVRKFDEIESIPRILCERGSQGFLVGLCDPRLHPAISAASERVPVVCCQRQEALPYHTVRFSVAACVRLCWQHLWDAGYRRIGCAVMRHNPRHLDDHDRLGAALALLDNFLPQEKRIPPLKSHFHDYAAYTNWLHEYEPEAVFGFHPEHVDYTRDAKGREIPYVTLHARVDEYGHVPGAWTSKEMFSREVLRQMSSLIRHGQAGLPEQVYHHLVEPTWHDGAGVPPAVGRRRRSRGS